MHKLHYVYKIFWNSLTNNTPLASYLYLLLYNNTEQAAAWCRVRCLPTQSVRRAFQTYRVYWGGHSGPQKHFYKKSIVKPQKNEENLSFKVCFPDAAGYPYSLIPQLVLVRHSPHFYAQYWVGQFVAAQIPIVHRCLDRGQSNIRLIIIQIE